MKNSIISFATAVLFFTLAINPTFAQSTQPTPALAASTPTSSTPTASTPTTSPSITSLSTPTSLLPSQIIFGGVSWNRGATYPVSADTVIGIRIGTSKFFSYTDISTPVATTPSGSPPLSSSLTTGAAWIAAQSSSGNVSLIIIGQGGFNSVPITTAVNTSTSITPSISGSFGVAFRLGKTSAYLMPYVKLANPVTATNGNVISGVAQPGFYIGYGFNFK